MMHTIKKLLLSSLFCVPFSLSAATQLDQQQAEQLEPFKEITIRGLYYSILEYQRAVSSAADRAGAASFYIKDIQLFPANDRLRIITVDLYKADANKIAPAPRPAALDYNWYNGVKEFNSAYAQTHEVQKTISIRGYFPTPLSLKNEVAKKTKAEQAAGFYIYKISEQGSGADVTVYLFAENAPQIAAMMAKDQIPLDSQQAPTVKTAMTKDGVKVVYLDKDAIPLDSEQANKQNLTSEIKKENQTRLPAQAVNEVAPENVATAAQVAKPAESAVNSVQEIAATKSSEAAPEIKIIEPKRYTVTLPDGERIQELNDATALKMTPFKSVKIRGYYSTPTQISKEAAKKASENGAKYYHISRVAQDAKGPNKTVYIDLYN